MQTRCCLVLISLALALLLSACGPTASPTDPGDAPPAESGGGRNTDAVPEQARTIQPVDTGRSSATPRPSPSPTASPTESLTPSPTNTTTSTYTSTPTPTLTPTITITVTPSRTPLTGANAFPMSIVAMRAGSYPGSEIVLDEELTAAAGFRRYYVYYLSQGLKIYALLTVPDDEAPAGGWPGIAFNHGYIAPDEYRTTERYVNYVNRLADSGYVVFNIDYRGHGNSEGDPQGAYGDPGYEVDLLNAIASLKRHPLVNPQKIGLWGHSMGGYLGLRSMVISKDIKVGVIWAGVVAPYPDLLYNWPAGPLVPPANSRKWMDEWPAQFGSPEENPTFWNSISANSYLEDLSGPLQLHYGTSDEYVPPEFSETLARQVREANGQVDVYSYPNDNHNLTGFFNLAMDRTIAFFDTVLK